MAPTTTTTLPPLPAPPASGSSTNPLGSAAELNMQVSGVGALLGLNWGPVSVQTAINGLEQLAKRASGKGADANTAKAQLAQIQQDMFVAGYYGSKQPTHGSIGITDIQAFKKAAVGAAASGQGLDQYIYQQASAAQANGTSGAGTTVLTPPHVQEKIWSPQDIQAQLDATETATGQNFAQKLIGRDFTQAELQGIAGVLNTAAGQQAGADVANDNALQQEQMQAQGAVSGPPTNAATSLSGGPPNIQQYLAAVKQHESGGDYKSNSGDGAYGAYQFIPHTWNAMAQASGNGKYANGRADQAPPAVQDAVAYYMAQNYYNQYGHSWEMVARAWYDPAKVNDPSYVPPGNNGLSIGKYGQEILQLMGQQPGTSTPSGGATAAGFFAPTGPGLKQGRTDQGVDFSGKGALFAVGSGTVVSVQQRDPGWEGGTWLALRLDNPPDAQHSVVYYAEDLTPNVKVGQHVSAGTQVGTATGGSSGIEIGWGDPGGAPQALTRFLGKSYSEGVPTAEGQDFLSFIQGGANITGTAQYNGKNVVFQQPIVDQVPATLDPTAAAQQYVEQQMPTTFQSNNLFKIFDALNTHFGSALPGSDTPGKPRSTPLNMK